MITCGPLVCVSTLKSRSTTVDIYWRFKGHDGFLSLSSVATSKVWATRWREKPISRQSFNLQDPCSWPLIPCVSLVVKLSGCRQPLDRISSFTHATRTTTLRGSLRRSFIHPSFTSSAHQRSVEAGKMNDGWWNTARTRLSFIYSYSWFSWKKIHNLLNLMGFMMG